MRSRRERNTQLRGWEAGGRGIHSGEGEKQEGEEYTAERVGSRRERNTQRRGWEAGGRGIHSGEGENHDGQSSGRHAIRQSLSLRISRRPPQAVF